MWWLVASLSVCDARACAGIADWLEYTLLEAVGVARGACVADPGAHQAWLADGAAECGRADRVCFRCRRQPLTPT